MGPATRIVTPEAVILDLPVAGAGSRLLCRALDLVASFIVLYGLLFIVVVAAGLSGFASSTVIIIYSFGLVGVVLVYPVLMEALWRGRTLGKAVMGLRVVRVDGGPIGFRHAAVRGGLGLLEVWATLGSLGLLTMLLSRRDQRLGDMAAGTLVLRERRGGALRPVQMFVPPGCEHLVRTMDLGAMTEGDYELVRMFLMRWSDFPEPQRRAVAATMAGPLWQRFKHPVPGWLGPDYYLACLGAAYQLRHPFAPVPIGVPGPGSSPPSWGPGTSAAGPPGSSAPGPTGAPGPNGAPEADGDRGPKGWVAPN